MHQKNHSNKQNYHENSLFKAPNINRNIPKTAPRKTRKNISDTPNENYDISEKDFFSSMLAVDVQPICHSKRISKTPITGKRKKKVYDNEVIPIPKINTQKFHTQQESQRASTTTSVIRPERNNAFHFIPSNFSQTIIQIPESKSSNLIDPLTIKQIDTGCLLKKVPKSNQLSISYGSITTTKKMIQKPHSSLTNRSKSPKKKANTDYNTMKVSISNDIKKNSTKDEIQTVIEKVSDASNNQSKRNTEEQNIPSVKFDKKAFLKKFENEDQDIRVRSTISFVNGRVLPSLHYQKEPDRYVIACAIHIEFSFNFFTLTTNPIMEKHLIIDEESYDLFDSTFEYSNRLYRSSRYIRIQKEILQNSCYKDPLTALMTVTPSLTRRNIEKQHFFQQMKIFPSNSLTFSELSSEIQKKYPNYLTTDSAFPLIQPRIDCTTMPNNDIVIEESDDDNIEKSEVSLSNYSCNLSSLKNMLNLL